MSRLASQLAPASAAAVVVDVSAMTMARTEGVEQLVRRLRVLHAPWFEGPSSPEDEAIVLVIECPTCGMGVLVSAYGPAATAEEADVLAGLGAAYERTARAKG